MNIRVDHIALIHCDNLTADKSIELPEPATVTDLLNALGISTQHQKAVVPFINSERAKRTSDLHDGDEVFLSLAVGGG